jgi:hypothetical protein
MNKLLTVVAFLGLLNTLACEAEFDPGSRVQSFRVLGQEMDVPFAQPGETVNVTSLSYDPQGRTVSWAWAACVNPDSATVQGCFDKIAEDAQKSGTSPVLAQGAEMSDFSYTVPANALDSLPESAKPSALIGIASVACPGDLSIEAGPNHLPFTCKEAGTGRAMALEEYVIGVKRIQVRANDRNENPVIEQVFFDGEEWPEDEMKTVKACNTDDNQYKPCADDTKHEITARPTAGSVQSGTTEFGVAFTEQVIIEYYATEGVFEYDVKIAADPKTGWAARKAASGKDLTIWMVLHDDRGGATWAARRVSVE